MPTDWPPPNLVHAALYERDPNILTSPDSKNVQVSLAAICSLLRDPPPMLRRSREPGFGGAKSAIDHQQRRGAGWDAVDEAIETYDQWMLDDDYEANSVLRTIIERLRFRRGAHGQSTDKIK